jgi:GNAT superfamily N-acetyltransferase
VTLQLSTPQSLLQEHRFDLFQCGEAVLDEWLKRRAQANQLTGASRTFVVVDPNQEIFGYYAMAVGAVSHQVATGPIRRNMPDPIPVMVLARLAVDLRAQGIKLGASLLQDAVNRAVVVHAINTGAKQFYEHYGFQASPIHPMTLMLKLGSPTI